MNRKTQENDNLQKWVSYEKSEMFKNYIKNKSKESSEDSHLEIEVFNKSELNFSKTRKVIRFFANTILREKVGRKNWKMEVWVDENEARKNPEFSCGVALKRNKKSTIYAKKVSTNLSDAVKQSIKTLNKALVREQRKLNTTMRRAS